MSPEEKERLASFIVEYVKRRVEIMAFNAVKAIEDTHIDDNGTVNFDFSVHLSGAQLKLILSGELAPSTAVKMCTFSEGRFADHEIRLDKEPDA